MNWYDIDPTPEPLPAEYTTLTPRTILAAVLVSIPLWLLILFVVGIAIGHIAYP